MGNRSGGRLPWRLLLAAASLTLTAACGPALNALRTPEVPREVYEEVASVLHVNADSVRVGPTGNTEEQDVLVLAERTCSKQCVIDRLANADWKVSGREGNVLTKNGVRASAWVASDFSRDLFVGDWLKTRQARPEQGLVFLSVAT